MIICFDHYHVATVCQFVRHRSARRNLDGGETKGKKGPLTHKKKKKKKKEKKLQKHRQTRRAHPPDAYTTPEQTRFVHHANITGN